MSEPKPVAVTGSPPGAKPTARAKFRIRFRKSGELRWLSHHDLMDCVERMLRRAALPYRSTQGFHPKPRMVFALSLALGIVGCAEVLTEGPPFPTRHNTRRWRRRGLAGGLGHHRTVVARRYDSSHPSALEASTSTLVSARKSSAVDGSPPAVS